MSAHPTNGSTGPIAPQHDLIDRLFASVKVIAAIDCAKHPDEPLCTCPAALASMDLHDIQRCKEQYFCHVLESRILDSERAFSYDGTQQSHHAFLADEGLTPKHFARDFLKHGIIGQVFAPAGRLQDTIKEMLAFWVMRTKQWVELYGDRKAAKECWSKEKRPEIEAEAKSKHKQASKIPREWFTDEEAANIKPGTALPVGEFTYGPPWHRNTITLMALGCDEMAQNDTAKVHMVKCGIVDIKHCHENCEMSEKIIRECMPKAVNEMSRLAFGKNTEPVEDMMRVEKGEASRDPRSVVADKVAAEICLRKVTEKWEQQEVAEEDQED